MLERGGTGSAPSPFTVRINVILCHIGSAPTKWLCSNYDAYALPVQAADLCIYCVNCAYRLPTQGMTAAERLDVKNLTSEWIAKLQYHGEGYRDGQVFKTHGIVYVPDPYESRQ